jgi:hypothetical protein
MGVGKEKFFPRGKSQFRKRPKNVEIFKKRGDLYIYLPKNGEILTAFLSFLLFFSSFKKFFPLGENRELLFGGEGENENYYQAIEKCYQKSFVRAELYILLLDFPLSFSSFVLNIYLLFSYMPVGLQAEKNRSSVRLNSSVFLSVHFFLNLC